jgi:hypothetical protein
MLEGGGGGFQANKFYVQHHLIEEIHVAGCHVHFHPEAALALSHLPFTHVFKEPQVLFRASVSVWGHGAAFGPFRVARQEPAGPRLRVFLSHLAADFNFVARLEANVTRTLYYEFNCESVQIRKQVRRIRGFGGFPPHPLHVLSDVVNIFLGLGIGVGVVEPENGLKTRAVMTAKSS